MTDETPTKVIVNCKTGVAEVIPLTPDEIAERELMAAQAQAERELQEAVEAEQAALKLSAQQKLAALGLTEAEIAALAG